MVRLSSVTPSVEEPTRRTGNEMRTDAALVLPPDERIGRYEVGEMLGAGGMGVVVAAVDPELGRRVAIKLVRPGGGPGHGHARLLAEARAVARLSHPNVVPVYDVGVARGRVFMAMELVPGETLAAWTRTGRPWRDVLRLYLEAGRGLVAAHDAGIVHRDIKPSNVLLGSDGRPRVMDFGLASGEGAETAGDRVRSGFDSEHSGSQTGPTDLASAVGPRALVFGTPAYMAPEQLCGEDVDARADQFSFCVAIWRSVTGEFPFVADSDEARLAAISAGDTRPIPARIGLPRRVERVLRRGMHADPAMRWPSMRALLSELDVSRRPARRPLMWAGGVGALALAAAIPTSKAGVDACAQADADVDASWNDARREAVRDGLVDVPAMERTFEQLSDRLDRYAARWADVRTAVCATDDDRDRGGVEAGLACLDRGRVALASVTDLLASGDGEVRSHAHALVGQLPDLDVCGDPERLARRVPVPETADAALAVARIRARIDRAAQLQAAGRYDEGLRVASRALADARRADFGPVVAEAVFRFGNLQSRTGDFEGARASFIEASALATEHRHDRIAVTSAADLVYIVGYDLGRTDEAQTWADHADAALQRWGRGTFEESHVLLNLGALRQVQGRVKEAREIIARALEVREAVLEPDDPALDAGYANLAAALGVAGDAEGSLEVGEALLERKLERYGEVHPSVADSYNAIGVSHHHAGRRGEAIAAFEKAIEILDQCLPRVHPAFMSPVMNLAGLRGFVGDTDGALEMYGRASEVVDAAYPHDHARRGMLENNIGVLYRDLGQDDVARAHFERSRTLLQRHGSDHVDVAAPLSNLASIALDEERYDDAFALVTRAIEVREAELGSMHVQLATPLVVLGRVQDARGETEAARAAFERAIAVAEAIGGPDHPQAASAAEHLAGLLLAQGDVEEARAAATRSLATRERIAEMPTALASAQFTLAQVLARSEPARARELAALSLSTYVDAGRPYEARVEQIRTWQRQHGR